jgi:hypothetical protein
MLSAKTSWWKWPKTFRCCTYFVADRDAFVWHFVAQSFNISSYLVLQAPIKLLFPKTFDPSSEGKNFSMLGNS